MSFFTNLEACAKALFSALPSEVDVLEHFVGSILTPDHVQAIETAVVDVSAKGIPGAQKAEEVAQVALALPDFPPAWSGFVNLIVGVIHFLTVKKGLIPAPSAPAAQFHVE